MNERIRELAEQARAEVRADWDKGNKIPYPEAHDAFQRDNDQKFAELIVKEMVDECAKVCVQHAGWTPDMIAKQVKEHFGVEE